MTELAFRAYNDGANIVGVAFPVGGGDEVLRKSIPQSAIDLETVESPPPKQDMQFGTWKVRSRKALEKGGLELVVNYGGERISITPLTHVGNRLESLTVRYTFSTFCVKSQRQSDKTSEEEFRISADKLPLSDETWP